MIHATAVIGPDVELGTNVSVGPYAVIQGPVKIGDGCQIGPHALIEGQTTIGANCRIFKGAAIGGEPQDLKYKNESTHVEIGERTTIREFVTVNLATGEGNATRIGHDNLLMAYVHIAHNCVLGNNVILANAVNLAGHVTIEDFAIVGGMTPIHQFVHVGAHCMIGGASRVSKDILPYIKVAGNPLEMSGLNSIGLQRRGFAPESIRQLKQAYKLLFRSDLNVSQAVTRIKEVIPDPGAELNHLLTFIEKSERGISR